MTVRRSWTGVALAATLLAACSADAVVPDDGLDAVTTPVPPIEATSEQEPTPEPTPEPQPSEDPSPETVAPAVSEQDALAAAAARAQEQDCDDGPRDGGHQVVGRQPGALLVYVVCFVGAYQPSGELLVWDGTSLVAVPVEQWQFGEVLEGNAVVGFIDEGPTDLSPDGVQVGNDVKYRGLGDCGLYQRWVFTGAAVVLDLAREQECSDDGEFVPPDQWPVVYER